MRRNLEATFGEDRVALESTAERHASIQPRLPRSVFARSGPVSLLLSWIAVFHRSVLVSVTFPGFQKTVHRLSQLTHVDPLHGSVFVFQEAAWHQFLAVCQHKRACLMPFRSTALLF